MKKFALAILIFSITLLSGISAFLYLQRSSRPIIFCGLVNDKTRPRDYCLMNPFRDKRPEKLAEEIL